MFIPFPFSHSSATESLNVFFPTFPYEKLAEYTAALLSISCMLYLGIADDLMDLKWRYKVFLPAIATVPILTMYSVSGGVTSVIVPIPLRFLFGTIVDLKGFFYLYMTMMTTFCTNSVNILAGVNGLEAGQTLVISVFMVIHNLFQILFYQDVEPVGNHLLSLFLVLPLIGVTSALLKFNWYPAKIFVGDTFCYFGGMTLAVAGILGHCSKTMMLFFIPQLFNFLYSIPQLFKIIPCPRHRLPKLDEKTGLMLPSMTKLENKVFSGFVLRILLFFRAIRLEYINDELHCNNLTLINLVLVKFGPMTELKLTKTMLCIQIVSNLFGFFVRYQLAHLLF